MNTTFNVTSDHFVYDDGGRSTAKGHGGTAAADDCVTRAIAIAIGIDYAEVYAKLTELQHDWCHTSRTKEAKHMLETGRWHARHGVHKVIMNMFLEPLGWTWTPTMGIGTGCTVHLRADELPSGIVICSLSRHVATVIDGVIHDTHDPSRDGTRAVYGYWKKQ